MAVSPRSTKSLRWIASSRNDLKEFPEEVQDAFGYELFLAQTGQHPPSAKPLKGFGSGVIELIEEHAGGAYRAVYTVRLETAIYVLHAFQKKSKQGIKTPQRDIDLIKRRLKVAEEDDAHERNKETRK